MLSTDDKPHTVMKMMAEREEKLATVQARLTSMKAAPQVLDLESRRMEKEALKRIEDCRAVMGRRGDAARRALSALLDGKLTFKPRPDKRYEVTGKVVTGALVHLLERPQRDTEVSAHELQPVLGDFPAWLGGMTQEEAGLVMTLVAVA